MRMTSRVSECYQITNSPVSTSKLAIRHPRVLDGPKSPPYLADAL
jgi:hypothetical protein